MRTRFSLMDAGLFPETLPPCFVSTDAKRAFRGLVGTLDSGKFTDRRTDYVRYSATKHDGSRRLFATPNIISYFHICSFLWRKSELIEKNLALSKYSISRPILLDTGADRSIKVPSLSELSEKISGKIRHAPFILRADIAQCFHSIYTHSISWAAHGIEASKSDTSKKSDKNIFNELDFFVRNSQKGNTRGVLVGPDAYRIIAEFVLSSIDSYIEERVGNLVIGAARHVDDYYIGLRSEHDAQSVLSTLREVLNNFELNLNDGKTKILSSLVPVNDIWAQRLRNYLVGIKFSSTKQKVELLISEAISLASENRSDSPIKILLRNFDEARIYRRDWGFVEQNLQRIVQKHPHALDYACLLVAKRAALGLSIDAQGWAEVSETIIKRSLTLNHHHELIWIFWMMIVCDIPIPRYISDDLANVRNGHVRSLLIKAYTSGRIKRRPSLRLGDKLATTDEGWLANLVARSEGYSKAKFSGLYSEEFDHLSRRGICLIDLERHMDAMKSYHEMAISRTRYGYDDDDEDQIVGPDDDIDISEYLDRYCESAKQEIEF